MKILFVTNHYYPKIEPNAKRITGLAENLASFGHNVTVVTASDEAKSYSLNGVEIIEKKALGKFSEGKISRLKNHLSFLYQTMFFKHEKQDFVISSSPSPFNFISGYILSRRLMSKFILDIRDIWPEVFYQTGVYSKKSIVYYFFDKLSNWAYKRADAIITVSPSKVRLLEGKKHVIKDSIYLISNGFDESFIQQETDNEFIDEFNKNKMDINIVYFGNIGIAQDLKPFVKALQDINEKGIAFHILGDGNKLEELKSYASKIGFKKIAYYGKRSYKEVFTALKMSDFTYVSLGSDLLVDSIPTKIYEALAMGLPVLLTATGDSADLVFNSKLGKSIPVSESRILPQILSDFIKNLKQYENVSGFAIKFVIENYSRKNIAKELERILTKLNDSEA